MWNFYEFWWEFILFIERTKMGVSHEDTFSVQGGVFEISNEAFGLEYEPYKRLKSQQDVFFKKDTGELFAAEFLGDRVRLISYKFSLKS